MTSNTDPTKIPGVNPGAYIQEVLTQFVFISQNYSKCNDPSNPGTFVYHVQNHDYFPSPYGPFFVVVISLTARYHDKTSDHRLTWIFQKCEERVNTKKQKTKINQILLFLTFFVLSTVQHILMSLDSLVLLLPRILKSLDFERT